MASSTRELAAWLIRIGSVVLAGGVLLLLVRLALWLAWFAGGWIALAGLLMLGTGLVIKAAMNKS